MMTHDAKGQEIDQEKQSTGGEDSDVEEIIYQREVKREKTSTVGHLQFAGG